ncbi:TSUP family transporter [Prosthecobacter sp. SYSU 5D2]|uniref:TSUP family transporter n=1 Tax=Prosthecobacter sp. SYSU 5D2 TaxID=3134134 RepID=UPI0031FE60B0
MIPAFERMALDVRYLPLGGFISGFFGGLSGNQDAFRSLFLLKAGLSKEKFIATGIVLAAVVDVARLPVYAGDFLRSERSADWPLIGLVCLSAFLGAFLSARWLKKMEFGLMKKLVSALLLLVGAGLISGLF